MITLITTISSASMLTAFSVFTPSAETNPIPSGSEALEVYTPHVTANTPEGDRSECECTFTFDTSSRTGVWASMVRVIDMNGQTVAHLRFDMGSSISLPSGTYDFIYEFGSTSRELMGAVIVKEQVEVTSDKEFSISLAEAKNELKVENYDRNDNLMLPPIVLDDGTQITTGNISATRMDLFLSTTGENPKCILDAGYIYANAMYSPTIMISDVSSRYAATLGCFTVLHGAEGSKEEIFYYDTYPIPDGINESITLTNRELGYTPLDIRYDVSSDIYQVCLSGSVNYTLGSSNLLDFSGTQKDLSSDAVVKIYANCPVSETDGIVNTYFGTSISTDYRYVDGYLYIEDQMQGPALQQAGSRKIEACDVAFPVTITDDTLYISGAPYLFTGMELCADWIGVPMKMFSGREGQNGMRDFHYSFFKNGEELTSGTGRGNMYSYFTYNMYPPYAQGEYKVEITTTDSEIYDKEAPLSMKSTISCDLGADDPTPPDMTLVQIRTEDVVSTEFDVNDDVFIRLRAGDWKYSINYSTYSPIKEYNEDPEVQMSVSPTGQDAWKELDVYKKPVYFTPEAGQVYESAAISDLEKGFYDVRLIAKDAGGNSTVEMLYRAFEITDKSSGIGFTKEDAPILTVTGNMLILQDAKDGLYRMEIYEMSGSKVSAVTASSTSSYLSIPFELSEAGAYLIRLVTPDGNVLTSKIVR